MDVGGNALLFWSLNPIDKGCTRRAADQERQNSRGAATHWRADYVGGAAAIRRGPPRACFTRGASSTGRKGTPAGLSRMGCGANRACDRGVPPKPPNWLSTGYYPNSKIPLHVI